MKPVLQPISCHTHVNQNTGAMIEEGTLKSERHITCYNLICLNLSLAKACMCHVNEHSTGVLTPQQSDTLHIFLSDYGTKVGLLIAGSQSKMSPFIEEYLSAHNVRLLPMLRINSKALTWNVDFRLRDRKLVVTDENDHVRYSGRPFPDFETEYARFLLSQNFFT